MNILVLHGPNMNLVGVRSSVVGEHVTLDKIDRALRRTAQEMDVTLKILQTNDISRAITFLQRNRNWADGCLLVPGPWARNGFDLLDTLQLCRIPTLEIHFNPDYDPSGHGAASILSESCLATETGPPPGAYTRALETLTAHLTQV